MAIGLKGSYFAINNPFEIFSRWLNPYRYSEIIALNGRDLKVSWTARADKFMRQAGEPLLAEMQLYFSCVVQKRVLFHGESELEYVPVNNILKVCFRPVQALSCAPEQFARYHPVKQHLSSRAAARMYPKQLLIDYVKGQWKAEYSI